MPTSTSYETAVRDRAPELDTGSQARRDAARAAEHTNPTTQKGDAK